MQIIGNLFYIILFTSLVGSIFALLSLFLKNVFHIAEPLWFGVLGAIFFLVPFVVPEVQLFAAEDPVWIENYLLASKIWLYGGLTFLLYFFIRSIFAYAAVKKYPLLEDDRAKKIFESCKELVPMKRYPELRLGTLKDPACVITMIRPVIILNLEILNRATDRDIKIILTHELMHIRRKHHLFQRIYDFVCCLHWFNPFVWIAKNNFVLFCEMDCDHNTIMTVPKISAQDYAGAMLRFLELVAGNKPSRYAQIGALSFLLTKQRFQQILFVPTIKKRILIAVVLTLMISLTITFSAFASRSYFYPYPASSIQTEYSDIQ